MKRLVCFILVSVLLLFTAIAPAYGAEKKKYKDPPKEKEIAEKNLIIGQFIIYMPKLTTDNLTVAKETMTDSQRMYYKSEFLNGEWVVMEDVRELYHLMLNDPTKIKAKAYIDGFKFIAQIDKDGNLIKFDGYDEFIDSLSQKKPDGANEIAGTLFDQLSGAENQTLLNSISNMNAESKSLEDKAAEVAQLYEKVKDRRLLTVVQQLENEIAQGSTKADDGKGIEDLKSELASQENLSDEDVSLLEALDSVDKSSVESMLSDVEQIYEKTEDKRLLDIIKQLSGDETADDGGIDALKEVLQSKENISDEDASLLKALQSVDKSSTESMLSNLEQIYDATKDDRLESIIAELEDDVAKKDGGLSAFMEELSQSVDKGIKAASLADKLSEISDSGSDIAPAIELLYKETGEERLNDMLNTSEDLSENLTMLLHELESDADKGTEDSLTLNRLNELKGKSSAEVLKGVESLYSETGEENLKTIADNLRGMIDNPSTENTAGESMLKNYDNAIKSFVDKLYGKGGSASLADLSDKDKLLITELEKINGVPQAVKEKRLLELQLQQAKANGDTRQEQALMLVLGMETYDKEQDMQLLADDLRNQGLDSLAKKAQDESMSPLQTSIDRSATDEIVKVAAAAALMLPQDEQEKITDSDILAVMSQLRGKNDELLSNLVEGGIESLKVSGEKLASERADLENSLKDKQEEIDVLAANLENLLNGTSETVTKEERDSLLTALKALENAENQGEIIENSLASKMKEASQLKALADKFAEQVPSDMIVSLTDAVDLIYENTAVDYEVDIVELMLIRYVFIEEYKAEKDKNHVDSMASLKLKIEELDYRINGILDMGLLDEEHVNLRYNLRLCDMTGEKSKKEIYEKKLSEYESSIKAKDDKRDSIKEAVKGLLN